MFFLLLAYFFVKPEESFAETEKDKDAFKNKNLVCFIEGNKVLDIEVRRAHIYEGGIKWEPLDSNTNRYTTAECFIFVIDDEYRLNGY